MKKIAYKSATEYMSKSERYGLQENRYFFPRQGIVGRYPWSIFEADAYYVRIMLIKNIHEENSL